MQGAALTGAANTRYLRGLALSKLRALVVSARLQPAVGVNNAPCNGRANVSESVRTGLYMYFEAGKPVGHSDFNEGGTPLK